ncbi:hypothetical protein Rleg_4485 [Rhizobium leguminosarum bv. trifolii WSM1325]|uniref:Uncharacterized protein n=1 Tax=Rhizobium leguminosarum bv. trifolii (strain WSM1325) TaxID=395491 RepID=C6B2B9_RHILS|nr:hypothetical protein Rleg_4485 [Rhizobium leguminosarum bv. trifolii WSM1325]
MFTRCASLPIVKILFTLPDSNFQRLLHVHSNCRKMER